MSEKKLHLGAENKPPSFPFSPSLFTSHLSPSFSAWKALKVCVSMHASVLDWCHWVWQRNGVYLHARMHMCMWAKVPTFSVSQCLNIGLQLSGGQLLEGLVHTHKRHIAAGGRQLAFREGSSKSLQRMPDQAVQAGYRIFLVLSLQECPGCLRRNAVFTALAMVSSIHHGNQHRTPMKFSVYSGALWTDGMLCMGRP